jgi:hypothetical protein
LKHHILSFDEECSKLVDRRKQTKLQWSRDPSEANEDELSDVRREAGRHFRNKKDKIKELESDSKNKNRDKYRGTNIFKDYHIKLI